MSDDDQESGTSNILELGTTFLNALSGGDMGDEWRKEVRKHVGPEGEIDYDTLVTAAITAGEQTTRMREQSRRTAATTRAGGPEQSQPLVDVRDIHAPGGGYAGTRIIVSRPDVEAFLSTAGDSVVVKHGSTGEGVDLPTRADGLLETDSENTDSVTEFIAYVGDSVLDPDAADAVETDGEGDDADE